MPLGTLRLPTTDELRKVAGELGMTMSDDELVQHRACLEGGIAAYNIVDQMTDELPEVKWPRTPGHRPAGAENPFNAWYVKSTIEGAATGKLKGKKVAIKDNICVAGVPMMNGASTLEGYVPDVDATVVTRILDAGGTIVGKTVCEYFCFSGGSHTSAPLPVHNPHRMGYSAGGSSSGSGAVVASGEVPMALGGDQGGSIRMPASFCGIYGMKPTHGLVPYSGIMPIELTLDHTGPMTNTVEDNALLLEVLAGPDGLDPRQYSTAPVPAYRDLMRGGIKGMKIALVKEGFGHPQSQEANDALVKEAADRLRGLGAIVDEVSIPLHALGAAIWLPVAAEGATVQMMHGNGFGFNWQGLYVNSLLDAHSNWRGRADELSETLKNTMLLGHYMVTRHRGHYYAKAQNLVRRLRKAYDDVLAQYDLLAMPTLPMAASKLPDPGASTTEIIQKAFEVLPNTAPFDCTHHPSMSIPCGLADGLPVGLMLTGKMYDEGTIYRAAAAFEAGVDWKSLTAS